MPIGTDKSASVYECFSSGRITRPYRRCAGGHAPEAVMIEAVVSVKADSRVKRPWSHALTYPSDPGIVVLCRLIIISRKERMVRDRPRPSLGSPQLTRSAVIVNSANRS